MSARVRGGNSVLSGLAGAAFQSLTACTVRLRAQSGLFQLLDGIAFLDGAGIDHHLEGIAPIARCHSGAGR